MTYVLSIKHFNIIYYYLCIIYLIHNTSSDLHVSMLFYLNNNKNKNASWKCFFFIVLF